MRTNERESFENLLKHIIYRNTFKPIGPYGERNITIRTRLKCLGETNSHDLPIFTRTISIMKQTIPTKIEIKSDTNYLVPEDVINQGIYLFRILSIYTNKIRKTRGKF